MKIQFREDLGYQQEAINAIVDIFQGQEVCEANFTVYSPEFLAKKHNINVQGKLGQEDYGIGYGNRLTLSEGKLLANTQNIQLANGLKPSESKEVNRNHLDFTIEMETGTGKTYVYLRSIMEMYRKYGFSKHIIVVPSIPIKEGVYKSLEITKEHFKKLYDNINYNFFIYDSSKLNEVRDFSTNDGLEIMVINIDAFSKSFVDPKKDNKTNIIHRYNDSLGYKPLDLIRNTNPIVFIDEPQSTMSTPIRKKAVQSLNPLSIVRYSATHKEKVNLMYKLDAIDAYEKKLVKQIEVGSVQTEGVNNQAYIKLISVTISKGFPVAKIEVDAFKNGSITRKTYTVKQNEDLEQLTDRIEYEGYILKDIHAVDGNEYIDFTSKEAVIRLGQAIGAIDEKQVKRALISKTIEEHLDKELVLNPQGIKVLSLFFIDSVGKYRTYDEEGNTENGEYAKIFEIEYLKLITKPKYVSLFEEITDDEKDASVVHNGYFSIDKKSKSSNKKDKFEYFKDTSGKVKADEDTYSLIMRDKEMLLSLKSKLRFIFSHSALKEGWDNPNVFQICTLKDAGGSEIKRRQEIGRGLRLCVNQEGERVYGHQVNTLTVMATESYKKFVDNFQKEVESDTGIRFGILESHSFASVVLAIEDETPVYLGQQKSEELFKHLLTQGYIDSKGKVQDELRTDLKNDNVKLPEEITENKHVLKQVLSNLKDAAGKLEIKNKDEKKRVKVNKRILESPEFKELWERVKYKTTFSVDFDSASLVKECINALDDRLKITRGKLYYSKASLAINIGGVEAEIKANSVRTETLHEEVEVLPDIVGYLQNETQLTRKSIVEILTGTIRLPYFKINPQKFIEGCIDIINEQMRMHIVKGIKYEKINNSEYYSQELFENEELFGYLKNNLKESTKSPYDYVVYDSNVESTLANDFENSNNISVYAKLPNWFKIDTPLGTYNPDWAILWKDNNEEKLFFVVESKGSTGLFDLRPKEKGKIDCGKKHFNALDSEMIEASNMSDVENHALKE
ncbi:DEAD/DEAH box helicase family protein [Tenacibaculum finnmarkense]|uniref:type III restriction-modification system endonuclease n=1 Tax=Tenacibaculum finnmarkense TaxID=2781243 RepID=UPI001EFB955C|nr:DEAD/DEAH box helicase family protein [Tenacibaculum finnmarkense]MCG8186218.1 DEAD/DEAH box helicase family protein [Tenacibaculum finnmarkense genomovar finnmarkense]MCG8203517.1 DEAD/DEAH box helicase family protein [Tenacibaculum finnmarkense genomovar finnmarkense]MCG8220415.1 DEAD/DEAH box helicase family protein [Tenacibaculum finnmarkense genomovar finnmarkense]MCG8223129.1 DEAD/DEAH box helicase family protein [Tenacibaculum finnmarkense genomovar finnmarkense]MCG8228673.1 DEAD/DEA